MQYNARMRAARPLFTVSWIVLLLISVAVSLLSIGAAVTGLTGGRDVIVPPNLTLEQLDTAGPGVVDAIRGRRVTAATWALAYGLLHAFVVLVPYRRGERWAWWALLVSLGVGMAVSAARAVTIPGALGTAAPLILLGLLALGLLAGAPRIFGHRDAG